MSEDCKSVDAVKSSEDFTGTLGVISGFDPFLTGNIEKYDNAGTGTPSYLLSHTRLELIGVMGESAGP